MTCVGRKAYLGRSSCLQMPVSTKTVSIPASMPPTMSVSMRSPIMMQSDECCPTLAAADRNMMALGLPAGCCVGYHATRPYRRHGGQTRPTTVSHTTSACVFASVALRPRTDVVGLLARGPLYRGHEGTARWGVAVGGIVDDVYIGGDQPGPAVRRQDAGGTSTLPALASAGTGADRRRALPVCLAPRYR